MTGGTVTQYAWKIYDKAEDRVEITLSASEANHWYGLHLAKVTIISWEVSPDVE